MLLNALIKKGVKMKENYIYVVTIPEASVLSKLLFGKKSHRKTMVKQSAHWGIQEHSVVTFNGKKSKAWKMGVVLDSMISQRQPILSPEKISTIREIIAPKVIENRPIINPDFPENEKNENERGGRGGELTINLNIYTLINILKEKQMVTSLTPSSDPEQAPDTALPFSGDLKSKIFKGKIKTAGPDASAVKNSRNKKQKNNLDGGGRKIQNRDLRKNMQLTAEKSNQTETTARIRAAVGLVKQRSAEKRRKTREKTFMGESSRKNSGEKTPEEKSLGAENERKIVNFSEFEPDETWFTQENPDRLLARIRGAEGRKAAGRLRSGLVDEVFRQYLEISKTEGGVEFLNAGKLTRDAAFTIGITCVNAKCQPRKIFRYWTNPDNNWTNMRYPTLGFMANEKNLMKPFSGQNTKSKKPEKIPGLDRGHSYDRRRLDPRVKPYLESHGVNCSNFTHGQLIDLQLCAQGGENNFQSEEPIRLIGILKGLYSDDN